MSCADTVIAQANKSAGASPQQPAFHECVYMDVSLARHTTLVHPSFKLARNRTPPTSPVPSRPMSYRSPSPHPSARLPDEILAQIAQYVLGNPFDGLDVARPASEYRKPAFRIIDGLTRASRRLRAISLPEWFRLFIVGRADDWVWASRLSGMHNWVRHIICPAKALDLPTPTDVLSRFPYLRSASLALSRDYYFNPILPPSHGGIYPSAPATTEIIAGFEYRQPVSSFPSTMTSLSVRGSHGSETPLLRELAVQCPDLRSLRLAKCTMFDSCTKTTGARCNSRGDPYGQIGDGRECAFWGTFPFDHDIYFGSEGVEAYAFYVKGELAAELSPLQNLEEVSVGVYLTPHAALAEHRLAHYPLRHLQDSDPLPQNTVTAATPNLSQPPILLPLPSTAEQPPAPVAPIPLPAPPAMTSTAWSTSQVSPPAYLDSSLWSYDCHACRKIYAATTAATEHTAGLALAAALPRLKKIEWASFFESRADSRTAGFRRGTGTHEWRVLRDSCGAVVDVERVF